MKLLISKSKDEIKLEPLVQAAEGLRLPEEAEETASLPEDLHVLTATPCFP